MEEYQLHPLPDMAELLTNKDKCTFELKCKDGKSVYLPTTHSVTIFQLLKNYLIETGSYVLDVELFSGPLIMVYSFMVGYHNDISNKEGTLVEFISLCEEIIKVIDYVQLDNTSGEAELLIDTIMDCLTVKMAKLPDYLTQLSDVLKSAVLDRIMRSYVVQFNDGKYKDIGCRGLKLLIDHIKTDKFKCHPCLGLCIDFLTSKTEQELDNFDTGYQIGKIIRNNPVELNDEGVFVLAKKLTK
jgi:hypothetical protein